MSIRIIKQGILDTVQDQGRYGYQHLGINPGGAMDLFSSQIVNFIVGNDANEAVIEMHFPASTFLFQQQALVAIGGADLSPSINGEPVPLYHPIIVNKNCLLQFHKQLSGSRAYIAFREKLSVEKWLGSYSTNLKALAGGFSGRPFKKDDLPGFEQEFNYDCHISTKDFLVLPWEAETKWENSKSNEIFVLIGNEWEWLIENAQEVFANHSFYISNSSDRMGYLMVGQTLTTKDDKDLVSSAVCFGTIQLLADGQMIILMADHQTTGGYPRIAHVITAHLPKLAQMKAGDEIKFKVTDQKTAEEQLIKQQRYLIQLKNACGWRLAEFLGQDYTN